MKIIKHPYITLCAIFGIAFTFGYLLNTNNFPETLMWFSVIGFTLTATLGLAQWQEENR